MRKLLIFLAFVLAGCVSAPPAAVAPQAPKYVAMAIGENGHLLLSTATCPHEDMVAYARANISPVVADNLKEGVTHYLDTDFRMCWVGLDDGRTGILDDLAGAYAIPTDVFEPYDAAKLKKRKAVPPGAKEV